MLLLLLSKNSSPVPARRHVTLPNCCEQTACCVTSSTGEPIGMGPWRTTKVYGIWTRQVYWHTRAKWHPRLLAESSGCWRRAVGRMLRLLWFTPLLRRIAWWRPSARQREVARHGVTQRLLGCSSPSRATALRAILLHSSRILVSRHYHGLSRCCSALPLQVSRTMR